MQEFCKLIADFGYPAVFVVAMGYVIYRGGIKVENMFDQQKEENKVFINDLKLEKKNLQEIIVDLRQVLKDAMDNNKKLANSYESLAATTNTTKDNADKMQKQLDIVKKDVEEIKIYVKKEN